MKKGKLHLTVYLLLLAAVVLMIPSLVAQSGGTQLGLQAFHPVIAMVLVMGWGLIFLCSKSSLDFAYKTACIALGCGLLLIAVQPIMNGYDESEHLFKVIASLDGKGLRYEDYNYEISDSFFTLRSLRGNGWWGAASNIPWSDGTTYADALTYGRAQPTYPVWGYLFSIIGVGLTRLLHAPLFLSYLAGKVTNLIGFVCLGTLAMKLTPKYKTIFAVFMCMPGTLFVVSSYHCDSTTYGLIMLVIACFLKWREQEKVSIKEWLCWCLLLLLLVPLKFPYIGLLGLVFLLPKSKFRFAHVNLWKAALILVVSTVALLWCTQISPSFVEWIMPGFDREGQLAFIKTHPVQTLWIFVSSIVSQTSEFIDSFFCMSGYDGTIMPGLFKEAHAAFVCLLLLLSERTEWKKWQKIWLFCMTFGIWIVTDLALYVTFTPVGSLTMYGVQGRYLTPLLFTGAMIIPKIDQTGWKDEQIKSVVCNANIIFAVIFAMGIGYHFYF